MKILTQKITCVTKVQTDFYDITDDVRALVAQSGITNGTVCVFAQHTTMGVLINHNEPMLLKDIARVLDGLAPVNSQYAHDLFELRRGSTSDGRSNGHSHCKAAFIGTSEHVPVVDGRLALSEIQSIFAVDLDGPRNRDVLVQISGL